MSDDIVQRLRDACPATQDFTHTAQGALMDEAADAIEALTAERDRLRKAILFWLEAQEPDVDAAINMMRAALKGETP